MMIFITWIPHSAHKQNKNKVDHKLDDKRPTNIQSRVSNAKSFRVRYKFIDNRQSQEPISQKGSNHLRNNIDNRCLMKVKSKNNFFYITHDNLNCNLGHLRKKLISSYFSHRNIDELINYSCQRHGRIDMRTRDTSENVDHNHDGQAKSEAYCQVCGRKVFKIVDTSQAADKNKESRGKQLSKKQHEPGLEFFLTQKHTVFSIATFCAVQ